MYQRTIVKGEYGDCVIIDDGRRELTDEERKAATRADRLGLNGVRTKFRCSDSELDLVLGLEDFPKPIARTMPSWLLGRTEPIWSRRAINRFLERRRAIQALLPESV